MKLKKLRFEANQIRLRKEKMALGLVKCALRFHFLKNTNINMICREFLQLEEDLAIMQKMKQGTTAVTLANVLNFRFTITTMTEEIKTESKQRIELEYQKN